MESLISLLTLARRALGAALCRVGWHGPDAMGWRGHHRSQRTAGFERTCGVCGAVWHGREVETRYTRTVGDWERVK